MKWVDLLMILIDFLDLGPLGLYEDIDDARPRARDSCTSYATENTDYLTNTKIGTPYRHNTDIQSLRAGFFREGGNITALANCRQIAANCRHVTRGLYITLSGATTLLLSFL
jgi:hypothetical protein